MRDLEIDLTDPEKPILWVKGKLIQRYSWKKVKARELMSSVGWSGRKKETAKDFYKHFGVPASVCAKFLNNGLFKMSVGAVQEHKELCYIRRQLSPNRTIKVCGMKEELDQALKDGIKNITPFIAGLEMNPKQLKEHFGNANWKAICKNSFSRNLAIAEALHTTRRDGPGGLQEKMPIESLLNTPSSVFKYNRLIQIPELATYMNKKCKISFKELQQNKNRETHRTFQLIRDTENMAIRYGEKFSYEWSWRKMQEKHGELSRIAIYKQAELRKQQDAKYSTTLREGKQTVWEKDGVKATFVDTYTGILEEGVNMHHCVGSYAWHCYENLYAVIHLEGDGEKTTLGVHMSPEVGQVVGGTGPVSGPTGRFQYSLNQHFGVGNEHVKSEKHSMLADYVIEWLNTEPEMGWRDYGRMK